MKNQISYGLKVLFMVHFVLGLIFGLLYLLIPETWGSLVGWPVKEPAIWRTVGAAILGFSFGSLWAYRASTWEQVRIVVLTELVWPTLAALVLLFGLLFNAIPAAGWLSFVIMAGFAIAFYVFFTRQEAAPATSPALPKPAVKQAVRAVAKAPARAARRRRRT